jgi:hypothetical protein
MCSNSEAIARDYERSFVEILERAAILARMRQLQPELAQWCAESVAMLKTK